MLLILPIHSFVLVPIFLQAWTSLVLLGGIDKNETKTQVDPYSINAPLFISESQLYQDDIFFQIEKNPMLENREEDFV